MAEYSNRFSGKSPGKVPDPLILAAYPILIPSPRPLRVSIRHTAIPILDLSVNANNIFRFDLIAGFATSPADNRMRVAFGCLTNGFIA
jgi:hypothetical protein